MNLKILYFIYERFQISVDYTTSVENQETRPSASADLTRVARQVLRCVSNTHVFPRTTARDLTCARNYGSLQFVVVLVLPLIRPARCGGGTDFKHSSLIPITFVGQWSAGASGRGDDPASELFTGKRLGAQSTVIYMSSERKRNAVDRRRENCKTPRTGYGGEPKKKPFYHRTVALVVW